MMILARENLKKNEIGNSTSNKYNFEKEHLEDNRNIETDNPEQENLRRTNRKRENPKKGNSGKEQPKKGQLWKVQI